VGFSVGFGLGLGLAILLAPAAGEDTQKLLARKVRKGKEYVQGQASDLRDQAAEIIEQGKQEVTRQRQGFEQAFDAGRKAYEKAIG